ncbi:MAG: hypothetical protein LBD88_00960 [Candidatus Peribacteria bacterium]|nr:hypothetical protein [Candidatus Peribacteria bacterium]
MSRGIAYSKSVGKNAVALLTTKSKLSLYSKFCHISSTLQFKVLIFFKSNSFTKSSIAFNFFQTESIQVNSTFGFTIASGISGKPQPVHISATFQSNSKNTFKIIESMKCFSIIHLSSLIAERLI